MRKASPAILMLVAWLAPAGRSAATMPLEAFGPSPATLSKPAETLLIPGVANTVGTHGVRWRSDLTLRNPTNDPVEARVYFLKSGVPNDLGSAARKDFFVPAGETRELRNVLGSEFATTGSGALLITTARGIFPNNRPGAALSAAARTSTPLLYAPGDTGTDVAPAPAIDATETFVANLRHEGFGEKGYRCAIGVVNLHRTQGLTVRIEYEDEKGELLATRDLHLPPLGNAQQNPPVRLENGSAHIARVEGSGPYVAYASIVDNATSEATFFYAQPEPGQPTPPRALSLSTLLEP